MEQYMENFPTQVSLWLLTESQHSELPELVLSQKMAAPLSGRLLFPNVSPSLVSLNGAAVATTGMWTRKAMPHGNCGSGNSQLILPL